MKCVRSPFFVCHQSSKLLLLLLLKRNSFCMRWCTKLLQFKKLSYSSHNNTSLIYGLISEFKYSTTYSNHNLFSLCDIISFIYSKYLFLTLAYSSCSFIISASLSPYLRSVHKKWIASIMQTHHKCFSDVWKLKFYRSYHLHSYEFTSRSAS